MTRLTCYRHLSSDQSLSRNAVIAYGPRTSILTAIESMETQNSRSLAALHKIFAPDTTWLSYLPDALRPVLEVDQSQAKSSAAQDWLEENIEMVEICTRQILTSMSNDLDLTIGTKIVSSLAASEMRRRYQAITPAQRRTLGWLFMDDSASQEFGYNFAAWLKGGPSEQNSLYWVSGKAGSGKSTLMRLLNDDKRTTRLISAWAGTKRCVVASCFFWISGSPFQKSLRGLLQTLLHQILSSLSDIDSLLFPHRRQHLRLDILFAEPWSDDELRDAIINVISRCEEVYCFFVLVDGLDEYDGNEDEQLRMIALLYELSKLSNVKMCVSSRPWNIFQDNFRETPQLKLELLTKQDIQHYVEDSLVTNKHFEEWSLADPSAAHDIVADVVQRANGVFLWVRLVVRSLLVGLSGGDSPRDLLIRLHQIPADLEEFFRQMLFRLDPTSLEQASQMFDLAMLWPHSTMLYYFMYDAGDTTMQPASARVLTIDEALHRQEVTKRRINARCMGLLECTPTHGPQTSPFGTTDFLHRTAKDFIASQEIQDVLQSWLKRPWDRQQAYLIAQIRMLQSCGWQAPWMSLSDQFYHLVTIMRELELTHQPKIFIQALRSAENNIEALLKRLRKDYYWLEDNTYGFNMRLLSHDRIDLLALAIEEGAWTYAMSKLESQKQIDINSVEHRPYLDIALSNDALVACPPSPALVSRLLDLGADPNLTWTPWRASGKVKFTIWERFLHLLQGQRSAASLAEVALVVKLLIDAGAAEEVKMPGDKIISCAELFPRLFPKAQANGFAISLKDRARRYQQRAVLASRSSYT